MGGMTELPRFSGDDSDIPPPPILGQPPASVLQAAKIMLIRAGIALIGIVAAAFTQDSVRDRLASDHPDWSKSKLDTAVHAGIVFAIIFGVVYVVLYVLLSVRLRQGKRWARTVGIVLGAIGIIGGLASLTQDQSALSKGVGAISFVIDLGVVYLLTRKDTSAYFNATRQS